MSQIGNHEKLLADWRVAQAKADALREFQSRGGEHRMELTAEPGFEVVGGILHAIMSTDGGYRATLAAAIKKADFDANVARKAYLENATAEAIADGVASAA